MGFVLDPLSLRHMYGIHPDLIAVVKECADKGVMPFTFGVSEGLRTMANQKIAVASGKSQTLNSRHLDGHAVDLVVLIHGRVVWDWSPYYVLADQMKGAADRCSIPLVWGGCWDKETTQWSDSAAHESAAYVLRSKGNGGHGFVDGPHIELPRSKYPSGSYVPQIAQLPQKDTI